MYSNAIFSPLWLEKVYEQHNLRRNFTKDFRTKDLKLSIHVVQQLNCYMMTLNSKRRHDEQCLPSSLIDLSTSSACDVLWHMGYLGGYEWYARDCSRFGILISITWFNEQETKSFRPKENLHHYMDSILNWWKRPL